MYIKFQDALFSVLLFIITSLAMIFLPACLNQDNIKKFTLPPAISGATYVGDQVCQTCHEEIMNQFRSSIHGSIADFEVKPANVPRGCESCHGPGSHHCESSDPTLIFSFKAKALEAEQTSAICLQCHNSRNLMKWPSSSHALNSITCINCHRLHQQRGGHNLQQAEPLLCYTCHQSIKAKVNMNSHHPIRERKMKCGDCHNPHGGERNLNNEERTPYDLCLKCHADKQGLFTYEHPPVVESCIICHESHGAIVDNLLKKQEPYLCLECHRLHAFSKHPDLGGIVGSRCTRCHSEVHGSNTSPLLGISI